jgi:hypothetical protein
MIILFSIFFAFNFFLYRKQPHALSGKVLACWCKPAKTKQPPSIDDSQLQQQQ